MASVILALVLGLIAGLVIAVWILEGHYAEVVNPEKPWLCTFKGVTFMMVPVRPASEQKEDPA